MLAVIQAAAYQDGPAGVHGVLDQAARALVEIGDRHGLRTRVVDDVRLLEDDAVYKARALALFTIGETPWNRMQRAEITSRLRAGQLGVVAIHSATDSCYAWDAYVNVVGARFDGHPWTQDLVIDVVDEHHPATEHLGSEWAWHDEVYQFRDLRPDARVLLRVRAGELDLGVPGAVPPAFGYPLSWCFAEQHGRVFSTSLGHFPAAWESTTFLRHVDGGLAWVLGRGE